MICIKKDQKIFSDRTAVLLYRQVSCEPYDFYSNIMNANSISVKLEVMRANQLALIIIKNYTSYKTENNKCDSKTAYII